MPPFHPVTSGTAPEISRTSLVRVRALCDCAIAYTQGAACVKTSTLRNGSPLSPMRFLTLCLEREGGARTNMTGENATAPPNARGFPRRSVCTGHIRRRSVFFPSPTTIEKDAERSMNFENNPWISKIKSSLRTDDIHFSH